MRPNSPEFAQVFVSRIYEMVEHLANFPQMGRMVPEVGDQTIREIIYRNYRIVYEMREDYLRILTVFHGSRRFHLSPE